jgi:DinB superfamily
VTDPSAAVLERLRAVKARLERHATEGPPPGLTDPDPGGVERWEAGQVWAHLAEFPGYWLDQIRMVLARAAEGNPQPIPFGRTKADPGRIAAIERDRNDDPASLLARVEAALREIETTLGALPEARWWVRGLHPTRGAMTVREIADEFLAKHLEEHAGQLDGLRAAAGGSSAWDG